MGWLRNFVRRHTAAIPRDRAIKNKNILSALYFFAAWNLVALAIFAGVHKNNPPTEEDKKYPSKYYAKIIGSGDAKVLQFKGFSKVGEYEITATKRPEPGRTTAEREEEEKALELAKLEEQNNGTFTTVGDGPESLKEFQEQNREDLNLLVEETNSL